MLQRVGCCWMHFCCRFRAYNFSQSLTGNKCIQIINITIAVIRTIQDTSVAINIISKMLNEDNTRTIPMTMMPLTTIKQNRDVPMNSTHKLLEQKRAELQQYLQSLKTEMATLEKNFEEEKANFQTKLSLMKETYNSVELVLTNLDLKAYHVQKNTPKPVQTSEECVSANVIEHPLIQNIPTNNHHREIKYEINEINDEESTNNPETGATENVLNSAVGSADIKVESETIMF